MRYKDKCDICGKFDFCKGKDNKVLCQKCFNNQEQKIVSNFKFKQLTLEDYGRNKWKF